MDTLVRWNPFRDLVRVQDELNCLFDRTFGGMEPFRPALAGTWIPALDVYETDEKLVAKMELPGIGSFSRAIALPQTADTEKVEASFDKGVLTIEIPKFEKAKPKKIEIRAKA